MLFSVHWSQSLKIWSKKKKKKKSWCLERHKILTNIWEHFFFPGTLYIKSCMWGCTERAYLNARQQCPLTSGWTMLNSLWLIRWLTLQRIQGHSLICHWANGRPNTQDQFNTEFDKLHQRVCACGIAQCCPGLKDHTNLNVKLRISRFCVMHQF